MSVNLLRRSVIVTAALVTVGSGYARTLAVVGDAAITDDDVIAALGKEPAGPALKNAVDKLVERHLILRAARAKGLAAAPEEVARAAALAIKAYGPNDAVSADAWRRYLAEEITVSRYIDLYVYPRVKTDDEAVKKWFVEKAQTFLPKAPQSREGREKLYPKYRREALYFYVKAEITRILAEDAAAARAGLQIRTYVATP